MYVFPAMQHVGWWSPTIIRGEDREAVHIPNHKFTVNVVRNLTQKTHWRIKTHLAISHLDVNKINVRNYCRLYWNYFSPILFNHIFPNDKWFNASAEHCCWHAESISQKSSSRAAEVAQESVFGQHKPWKSSAYGMYELVTVSCNQWFRAKLQRS